MSSTMQVTSMPQKHHVVYPDSPPLSDEKLDAYVSTHETELSTREEKGLILKAMQFCKNDVQPPAYCRKLQHIVAIPQINKGFDKPYTRAYAPELSQAGVSAETFIAFMDSLNLLTMAHPVLKTVSLAGNLAGWAPAWEAMVAGIAVQTVSDATSFAMIYYRIKKFIKQANAVYFNPRGLNIRIGSSAELAKLLGFPSPKDMVPELASEHMSLTVAQRRMLGIRHLVAELDCQVQQEYGKNGVFDKISTWSMKRQIQSDESNLLKARNKCARKHSWYVPGMCQATPLVGDRAQKKEARREAKERTKQAKKEEKIVRKGGDLNAYRQQEDPSKVKDKERESVSKLKWLLIENL